MPISYPEFVAKAEALRKLRSLVRKTAETLQPLVPQSSQEETSSPTTSPADIPPLNLPFPDDVLVPIMSMKASDKTRSSLVRLFSQRVNELQTKCTANYQAACMSASWLTDPTRNANLRKVYQKFYSQQCRYLVDSHLPYILEEVAKHQTKVPAERKPAFNYEYLPVLENYFEYNAYPSLPDRLLLARKSAMTPRQIEIWFQNRRNRRKEKNIPLRRLNTNIASSFSFGALAAKAPQLDLLQGSDRATTVERDTDSSDSEDEFRSVSRGRSMTPTIYSDRPAHAFPLPYSQRATVPNPFSSDTTAFRLPAPVWRRRPAPTPSTPPPPCRDADIDDLANKFNTIFTVRGPAEKPKRVSKMKAMSGFLKKWFAHQATEPPTAPLQAHIPVDYTPVPSLSHVPTDYRRPVWQLTSLRRRIRAASKLPRALPEWTVPSELPTRRKTSPFPRRVPTHAPTSSVFPTYPPPASSSRISSASSTSSLNSSSSSISSISDGRSVSLSAHSSMTSLDDIGEPYDHSLQSVDKPADGASLPFQDFSQASYTSSSSMLMDHPYQLGDTMFNIDVTFGFTPAFDAYDIPAMPFFSS